MHTRAGQIPIYEIKLPKPPMGNKIFCTQEPGMYILERGPVIWRCMSNTHVGSGSFTIYDGVPLQDGFFPDEIRDFTDPSYGNANGRVIFQASPAVMGMWMEDGYCWHGLTVVLAAEFPQISPCLSISWLPYQAPQPRIIQDAPAQTALKMPVEDKTYARPKRRTP